ncbi:hypothetical protein ACLI4Q_16875 [Natrialbaceae archaeon A-CW1-1]
MIDKEILPTEMCVREQWICWREEKRNGDTTKIPVDPKTGDFASSTDDRTWADLETALEYAASARADGIGFVFTSTDPIVGIDLDKCRDPETGRPDKEAKRIVHHLDSYTEVSPSGTGYHVLVQGELPHGRNRRGGIEMYDQSRFFTVTAEHVRGTPTSINERQEELEAIHEEFVAEADDDEEAVVNLDQRTPQKQSLDLEDSPLLEKARSAGNGEKFDRLWRGNLQGYDSQSEADMALCCILAFWTGGSQMQMDRLFRQSGLIRAKWDDVHYADGSTYGEKTLERAIAATDEFYEPPEGDVKEATNTESSSMLVGHVQEDSSGAEQAYLEEKNRLLEQRVDELEQTVTEQREQLETLTAERNELRALLKQREEELEKVGDQSVDKRPMRSRMMRLFRSS